MGLSLLATVAIAGAAVGTGVGIYSGIEASNEQEEQEQLEQEGLKAQGDNARAAAAQAQVKRDQQLEAIQSQQRVAAAAHGMALSSGSFSALQESSYNNFADATKTSNMNLQITEDEINSRMASARAELSHEQTGDILGGIGDIASLGMNVAGALGGFGSKSNSTGVSGSTLPSAAQVGTEDKNFWGGISKDMSPTGEYGSYLKNYQSNNWDEI